MAYTILDLPFEIIHRIFHYLQYIKLNDEGCVGLKRAYYTNDDNRRAIQKLRLTCRVFCKVASPFLCPLVKVSLDSKSLGTVEQISQCPFVRQGVRAVHVYLDCYPEELMDFTKFSRYKQEILKKSEWLCNDGIYLYDCGDTLDIQCPEQLSEFEEASNNYASILSAWSTYVNPDFQDDSDEINEYQQILQHGFDEFRRRHLEQRQLLTDDYFVNILAACISRMPNAHTLAFYDNIGKENYTYDDSIVFVNDKKSVSDFLTSPFKWELTEKFDGGIDLLPVGVLSQLPIAIYKAGAVLHQLGINCFHSHGNHSQIYPFPLDSGWTNLSNSFQHLRVFEFDVESMSDLSIRHDDINNYLSSALSSKNLERVKINLGALFENRMTSIGPALATIKWPRIRWIELHCFKSDKTDFESFCHGLGENLEGVYICYLTLQKGGWRTIMDILRDKVWKSWSERKFRVHFNDLGGELPLEMHHRFPAEQFVKYWLRAPHQS